MSVAGRVLEASQTGFSPDTRHSTLSYQLIQLTGPRLIHGT
jgi:hypothetical protein